MERSGKSGSSPPGHFQVYNTNYVVLGPGQSQVVNVLVFTNRGAWRTIFDFARDDDPIATSPLIPVTLRRLILHQAEPLDFPHDIV